MNDIDINRNTDTNDIHDFDNIPGGTIIFVNGGILNLGNVAITTITIATIPIIWILFSDIYFYKYFKNFFYFFKSL